MAKIESYKVNEGVNIHSYIDDSFKTMEISVDMIVPLCDETVAKFGVLPSIITRATKEYPDYTEFSKKLASLYGAHVDSSVMKLGGYQVLSLYAGGIASPYAFDGEDMFKELSDILFSILFSPLKDENGFFPAEGVEQEKRQISEVFDAEFNDKIVYARNRCGEILHSGQPEGIHRYGSKEKVMALTPEELTVAWDELLASARFEVFVLGNCEPNIKLFEEAFKNYGKSYSYKPNVKPALSSDITTEEMKLSQSKMVMGFRLANDTENRAAAKLMSVVLGGTPSSKLFQNVREKLHLCYYCSASIDSMTNVLSIDSGIETENIEKARDEILAQIEEMKLGHITDEEIEAAKLAMLTSYKSVRDSLRSTEAWCLSQAFLGEIIPPEEMAKKVMSVTKEEVIEMANKLSLDTTYILMGIS